MADSIVSVDTVTVTGGPATVNVQMDFGPEGQRGSLILYGLGKPTELGIVFPQTPQLLDWYINLDTSDEEYLYIYQYVNRDGANTWDRIFKIIPNTFSTNQTVTFEDGVGEVTIGIQNTTLPLLSVLLTQLQFGQYAATLKPNIAIAFEEKNNPLNTLPIASSFFIGTPAFDPVSGLINLPLTISAAQFAPNPTPDNVVSTFADMLSISFPPTETNVDGMYIVYVTTTSTFYVLTNPMAMTDPTSWLPYSNVQPLTGEKEVHITINVIS